MNQENILFPVDFSESSIKAARIVAKRAASLNAKVHAVHVVQELNPIANSFYSKNALNRLSENTAEQAKLRLSEFCREYLPEATHVVLTGNITERLLDYIYSHRISLVILTDRKPQRSAIAKLDSVTTHLMWRSPVPVLNLSGGSEDMDEQSRLNSNPALSPV